MNRKLGRKKDHREHLVRNLATSLILYETIDTTEPKAKEVKSFVDQLLARSKKNDLNTRRMLAGVLFDKNAVIKVMEELTPRYEGLKSGFIKSFHLKERLGDNSKMMRLELKDKKVFVDTKDVKEDKAEGKNDEAK